jgi:signal transduction histidine kinase
LSFYNPAKNQYAYKLEGFDKDWIYSGSRRYVAYTNINPGTYTFRVKGTNNDGVWNNEGAALTIIIKSPWWRAWWAYCLYAPLLIIGVIAVQRYQKQKLIRAEREKARKVELAQAKEIEKAYQRLREAQAQLVETEKINERLRISQELHDDIGGTLSGIVLYSHLAENQIQLQHTDEVERSLNKIQQSANDMVNKLSDIIWSINPEHNSIKNLFQKLREYATEMAAAKNIKVQAYSSESSADLQLPVKIRHNVHMLFKEAINNAVKYSDATLLQFNVHHSDRNITFEISDNGKGFDIAIIKRGNGLINMQKRANDIHAKFCLQSTSQKGTFISLQCSIEETS